MITSVYSKTASPESIKKMLQTISSSVDIKKQIITRTIPAAKKQFPKNT
ncbi:hypothetical protein [uncultured Gammaproteobacteria bacterium]|nr:hypothetical protein [uncultured Gammaproteobacteria bacterium]